MRKVGEGGQIIEVREALARRLAGRAGMANADNSNDESHSPSSSVANMLSQIQGPALSARRVEDRERDRPHLPLPTCGGDVVIATTPALNSTFGRSSSGARSASGSEDNNGSSSLSPSCLGDRGSGANDGDDDITTVQVKLGDGMTLKKPSSSSSSSSINASGIGGAGRRRLVVKLYYHDTVATLRGIISRYVDMSRSRGATIGTREGWMSTAWWLYLVHSLDGCRHQWALSPFIQDCAVTTHLLHLEY